jgi:hypothetical protein
MECFSGAAATTQNTAGEEMIRKAVVGARALLIGVLGVLFAWKWLIRHDYTYVPALCLIFVTVGVCYVIGRALLPESPVAGLLFIEALNVLFISMAAVATALAVLIAIMIVPPTAANKSVKTIVESLAAVVGGAVTSVCIAWAADEDASPLANHVREIFQANYLRPNGGTPRADVKYFDPDSTGERWVHSPSFRGADGWNFRSRWRRARGVAAELKHQH